VAGILSSFSAFAQDGSITGKVVNEKTGEALYGVVVMLQENTTKGAVTDFEGEFNIRNVVPGTYTVIINGTGLVKKTIPGVQVSKGPATLNVTMVDSATEIFGGPVVLKVSLKKETELSQIVARRTAPQISDGITAETIKKSPDNTTSDVLKRVPGASIQDNRFAIIRGLNDRYNQGFINGAPLPSTESDRKAFSFDIFPANMIDNMTILKTATPDMPADFAGGVIIINTRDIPTENFESVSLGASYNTMTTGRQRLTYETGKYDILGFDDGTRALPNNLPDTKTYQSANEEDMLSNSKSFKNTWKIEKEKSTLPGSSLQMAIGRTYSIKKKDDKTDDFGVIVSLSHNNSYRMSPVERRDYVVASGNEKRYDFTDSIHRHEVLFGGMLNLAYKSNTSKFSFKNIYTINSEDQVTQRTGTQVDENNPDYPVNVLNTAMLYSQSDLYSSQLTAEHVFPANMIKIRATGSMNDIYRQVPDFRKQSYSQSFDGDKFTPFSAQIPMGGADINQSGRFFSSLKERLYSANYDITVPFFKEKDYRVDVKTGGFHQWRNRSFDARSFGYVRNFGLSPKVLEYGLDTIFAEKNLSNKLFIKEDTRPTDSYDAGSTLNAAFLMLDNHFTDKVRFVWGVRAESYRQKLDTRDASDKPLTVDTTVTDILPSGNISISLGKNNRSMLRLSGSRTVSRPEFREIAPFAFYDFNLDAVVAGNTQLKRATINNFDVRYEFYPGGAQIVSASVFYKKFKNAIEMLNEPGSGAGSRTFGFQNAPEALNYGVELEFRKHFDFIDSLVGTKYWSGLTMFGNFSYIKSEVDLSKFDGASSGLRPLQGQSPYIINTGASYALPSATSFSVMLNRVGRRIAFVGNSAVPDIYENPRTMLDIQVAQTIAKRLNLKVNFSDLLAQDLIFYHDLNKNGKYDADEATNPDKDNAIYTYTYGRNISFSVSYKF
jgi:TonB-dependent receptor